MKEPIDKLKKEFKGIVQEFFNEAQLLIIMFNFWPEVQEKWLKELGYKKEEREIILKVSDLYAKRKVRMITKKMPTSREGIILIEDEVLKSLYEPRIMRVLIDNKKDALQIARDYLENKYPNAVIMDQKRIDELEDLMKLQGRSVDFLIFTPKKILSYQVELA